MVEYENLEVTGKDIFGRWLDFRETIIFKGGYYYNPSTNALIISISKKHKSFKLVKLFIKNINKEQKQ